MFSLFDVASVVNGSWCIVLPHTPDGSEDPLRDEYDRMIVDGKLFHQENGATCCANHKFQHSRT